MASNALNNRNVMLSLINVADSFKDIYVLFVRNRRGLRKLSSEAKGRLQLYQAHSKATQEALTKLAEHAIAHPEEQDENQLSNSINGDCVLFKYSKDKAQGSQGIFQTLEPDLFHNLIEKFAYTSRMKFFEKETGRPTASKLSTSEKGSDAASIEDNFAQFRCSCGQMCSLVAGFTSCCNKSINDVLFDVFDDMYINSNKSFAIKCEDAGSEDEKMVSSLFYVGNYAYAGPEASQLLPIEDE